MRIRTAPLAAACAIICIAAVARGAADAPASATDSLSIDEAVARVLERNPDLAAATREVDAREREAAQAGARPNPHLLAELENVAGSGAFEGMQGSEATLSIAQRIEAGGKRGRRVQAATVEQDIAAADRTILRAELIAATRRAYSTLWVAQRRADVASELERVAADVLEAASARVRAGAASAVERSRASVALETARLVRATAEHEASTAALRLASLWGDEAPGSLSLAADLTRPASIPSLAELQQRAEAGPRLARRRLELARLRAHAEVSRGERAPDLELSAGVRRFEAGDDHALLFGVALPLPLFDRRAAAITGADRRVEAGERGQDAEGLRVRTEIGALRMGLVSSLAEIDATRDRILPEAETAFGETREAYLRGRLGLTDVLDAERTLFQLKDSLYASVERHHAARADLDALLGEPAEESK